MINPGRLILASSHIGNPRDIPPRALEALRDADLTIFESESQARQFLKAAGVTRTYLCYSEHDEAAPRDALKASLREGKTAVYMSDQGSPGFEDPGYRMAALAYEAGAEVQVIPGPSAVTAAISACPFPVRQFVYAGLPPRESEERLAFLIRTLRQNATVMLMDTPYRLQALAHDLSRVEKADLDRPMLLALDISGPNERFWSGLVRRLGDFVATLPVDTRLNFVIVVGGAITRSQGRRRPEPRPSQRPPSRPDRKKPGAASDRRPKKFKKGNWKQDPRIKKKPRRSDGKPADKVGKPGKPGGKPGKKADKA